MTIIYNYTLLYRKNTYIYSNKNPYKETILFYISVVKEYTMIKLYMKATDLAKIIYECDIHALTDYYSFIEVEYDDADNDTISVFRHGYDCKKHVPKGMYLWLSPNEDEAEEFKCILERLFGTSYETQIFFESDLDKILKIED